MLSKYLLNYELACLCVLAGLFLLDACSSGGGTGNPPFTEWLTGSEFQTEYDNQLANSQYPAEIQGREVDGVFEFRAVFVPFTEPFAFSAFTALTADEFETQNASLTSEGYALQHWDQVAFSETKFFTAIWTNTSGATTKTISVSSGTCTTVANANNGISLGLQANGECLLAETTDRAECRATDNYAGCVGPAASQTLCPGGTTQGSTPYLPSFEEGSLFLNFLGSGSPVSSNGFCIDNSGACVSVGTNAPVGYWLAPQAGSGASAAAFGLDTNFLLPSGLPGFSVRCVFRIAP